MNETRVTWLAATILVLGAALRFAHLGAGIPHAIGVDEPEIMERAVRMMKTADFNPRFFDWPSLTIYLQVAVAALSFLYGAMQGRWNNLDAVSTADLLTSGRALTAVLGTATVWVTYRIARRWGHTEALVAALLMAVIPYHVRESHYALADVPMAFFTTVACLLALRVHERPTRGAFALAGLCAGLAASTKYNGSVSILGPLIVAACSPGAAAVRIERGLLVAGAAAGGFLIGTPYAVLDMPKFLNDYARLAAIFARERRGDPGWLIYLKHLRGALWWPALLLCGAGFVWAWIRAATGPDRVRWAILAVFAAVYFWVMATSYQIYGRYLLPLFPVLSVLAAVAAVALGRAIARRMPTGASSVALGVIVVALVATPAWTSVAFNRGLGQETTVDRAYKWLQAHAPRGSKVLLERRVLVLPAPRYESVHVTSLLARPYEEYVNQGFEYIVSSSFEESFASPQTLADQYAAYRDLFNRAEVAAMFDRADGIEGPRLAILKVRR